MNRASFIVYYICVYLYNMYINMYIIYVYIMYILVYIGLQNIF